MQVTVQSLLTEAIIEIHYSKYCNTTTNRIFQEFVWVKKLLQLGLLLRIPLGGAYSAPSAKQLGRYLPKWVALVAALPMGPHYYKGENPPLLQSQNG